MLLCSLDFETTGFCFETDRVTEVGAILYSTGQNRTLETMGYLVKSDKPIPAEVTKLTGITQAAIDKFGYESKDALESLLERIDQADAVIGQNVKRFDKRMLEMWGQRENRTIPNKLWIDTRTDLEVEGKHLQYMCADEGWLNLFPHSAVSDCQSVLKLVSTRDINKVVERAQSPDVIIVSHQSRDNNDQAKALKFRWSPDFKIWYKIVKQMDVEEIAKAAPFDISFAGPEVSFEKLWYGN